MAGLSTISILAQTIGVEGVGRTELSEIEQDTITGQFVRELRVYEVLDDGTTGAIVLTLRLTGATQASIEQITPKLRY